jgi:hypothetical protein
MSEMGNESGTYGGDLIGEVNGLGNLEVAGLDRALKVDVSDLLAEVGLGANEADESVLDG